MTAPCTRSRLTPTGWNRPDRRFGSSTASHRTRLRAASSSQFLTAAHSSIFQAGVWGLGLLSISSIARDAQHRCVRHSRTGLHRRSRPTAGEWRSPFERGRLKLATSGCTKREVRHSFASLPIRHWTRNRCGHQTAGALRSRRTVMIRNRYRTCIGNSLTGQAAPNA